MGYYKACQSTHNRDSREREGKVGQKYIWRNYGWKLSKPKEENISRCRKHVCVPSFSVVSDSLWPHGLWPTRLLCPWNFLGKNTAMGRHFLLQGIFPTQGSNLCVLHCRQVLYHCATREASTLHLILAKRPGNHILVNTCAPNTGAPKYININRHKGSNWWDYNNSRRLLCPTHINGRVF